MEQMNKIGQDRPIGIRCSFNKKKRNFTMDNINKDLRMLS